MLLQDTWFLEKLAHFDREVIPERRMHAVQYFSYPDYDFRRFRDEAPGKYESPADIGPNEWIRVKIVVSGSTAQLFLNDASEATLVVEDLKHGPDVRGAVGLWIDAGTLAHAFAGRLDLDPD